MNIKKKSGSYDAYTMDLSYVEMKSIEQGLASAQEHSTDPEPDPVRDNMLQGLRWYSERLPLPGEDEETAEDKVKDGDTDGLADEDLTLPAPEEELPVEGDAPASPDEMGVPDMDAPGSPLPHDEENPFPDSPEYARQESQLPDPAKYGKGANLSPCPVDVSKMGIIQTKLANGDIEFTADELDEKRKALRVSKASVKEGRMDRVGTHKTSVTDTPEELSVRLWNTEVVKLDKKTGVVTLNTGGWATSTTFARMNQTASQFGLPFRAFRKGGACYVAIDGKVYPFKGDKVSIKIPGGGEGLPEPGIPEAPAAAPEEGLPDPAAAPDDAQRRRERDAADMEQSDREWAQQASPGVRKKAGFSAYMGSNAKRSFESKVDEMGLPSPAGQPVDFNEAFRRVVRQQIASLVREGTTNMSEDNFFQLIASKIPPGGPKGTNARYMMKDIFRRTISSLSPREKRFFQMG